MNDNTLDMMAAKVWLSRTSADNVLELISSDLRNAVQLFTYTVIKTIAILKVMAPIDAGMAITPTQAANIEARIAGTRAYCTAKGAETAMEAYKLASEDKPVEIGELYVGLYNLAPYDAADALVIAMMFYNYVITQHVVPYASAVDRAADLRLYIKDTRDALRNTPWCTGCAIHVLDILEMSNDDLTAIPPADPPPIHHEDMSWLNGIDFEGRP